MQKGGGCIPHSISARRRRTEAAATTTLLRGVPTSHSLLSDYVAPEKRALALGIFQTGGAVGVMAGFISAGWIADQYGWRAAFFLIGLPGVLIALIAKLTLKDPPRGNYTTEPEPEPEPFMGAVRSLLGRKTFVQLVIAYSIGLFGVYGINGWTPTFFIRVHDMSLTEVGWWVGISSGLGGVLGTFAGAVLAPRLIARDRRWELWWPAWTFIIAIPMFVFVFMTANLTAAFVMLFLATFVTGSSVGPGMAAVQSLAEPQQRATAVAFVMLTSAILGQGLGPFLIGFGSDLLTPSFADDGLRWSMIFSLTIFVWSFVHFMIAARHQKGDIVS